MNIGGGLQNPPAPAKPVVTVVSSGTTGSVTGPLTKDQVLSWESATSGTKVTTIPTATGSRFRITVVDTQQTADPSTTNSITIAPVAGSVAGSPNTTTIVDAGSSITLFDKAVNLWVKV